MIPVRWIPLACSISTTMEQPEKRVSTHNASRKKERKKRKREARLARRLSVSCVPLSVLIRLRENAVSCDLP